MILLGATNPVGTPVVYPEWHIAQFKLAPHAILTFTLLKLYGVLIYYSIFFLGGENDNVRTTLK